MYLTWISGKKSSCSSFVFNMLSRVPVHPSKQTEAGVHICLSKPLRVIGVLNTLSYLQFHPPPKVILAHNNIPVESLLCCDHHHHLPCPASLTLLQLLVHPAALADATFFLMFLQIIRLNSHCWRSSPVLWVVLLALHLHSCGVSIVDPQSWGHFGISVTYCISFPPMKDSFFFPI